MCRRASVVTAVYTRRRSLPLRQGLFRLESSHETEAAIVQIDDLVQRACTDTSESVQAATQQLLLPAFAYWAMELNQLHSDVLIVLLDKAAGLLKVCAYSFVSNNRSHRLWAPINFPMRAYYALISTQSMRAFQLA